MHIMLVGRNYFLVYEALHQTLLQNLLNTYGHSTSLSVFIVCVYIKDLVYLDAGPLPSSVWAGWKGFDSEVEVEALNSEPYRRPPYRRPIHRALQLSSEVHTSCGGGEL
jgi:hypothetical protein